MEGSGDTTIGTNVLIFSFVGDENDMCQWRWNAIIALFLIDFLLELSVQFTLYPPPKDNLMHCIAFDICMAAIVVS